jgi:nucleotide-binding universal stress UspA family protein
MTVECSGQFYRSKLRGIGPGLIQKGVQLAKSMKAKITGISVMPEQKYYLYQTDITVQVKEEAAKQHKLQANRNLSVIEKATKDAGVPCETLCEISDYPYETIIRVAEQKGCDLIMMASHGRRGVKGLLLGSETQKVLTHSKIPVLVYR